MNKVEKRGNKKKNENEEEKEERKEKKGEIETVCGCGCGSGGDGGGVSIRNTNTTPTITLPTWPLFGLQHTTESKIRQFDFGIIFGRVEQNVFRLDIQVEDSLSVQRVQCAHKVMHDHRRVILREVSTANDVFVKLTAHAQREHEIELTSHLEHLLNLHDVRVRDGLSNVFHHCCFLHRHVHLGGGVCVCVRCSRQYTFGKYSLSISFIDYIRTLDTILQEFHQFSSVRISVH